MDKNKISILILVICFMCLIVGVFLPSKKEQPKQNTNFKTTQKNMFTQNKIVLVKFSGVIDSDDTTSYFETANTAQSILDALKEVAEDDTAKGVILELNTPGGTVAMSQNIYDAIIELRKVKPVVVTMDDVAASGGYYIASAADRIYAQKGTLTGSIGVIFSTMDMHELLANKLAIKSNVIKSGRYKDIGSQLRPMENDEKALLQDIINDSYQQFKNAIITGRIERNDKYSVSMKKLDKTTLAKYADGRVFTGVQALKYGFVDGVGDLNFANQQIEIMAREKFKMGKNTEFQLVPYKKHQSWGEYVLSSMRNSFVPKSDIREYLPTSVKMAKKPLYLWE